jgi:predicted TIM-barrel fold metal-dependent hydrolase
MPVTGRDADPALRRLLTAARAGLAPEDWFDAHTHLGQNDPDGRRATAEEILDGLDAAGHRRALIFAMHEPDGYRDANDAVLAACAASEGRLLPLARVSPNAEDAVAEARRCLAAGARGFKLHPRSDAFTLPHPAVEDVVALAHEARAPVLFHAGRGIPHLGEAVVDLARRYPGARLILAHAGISDLAWIPPHAVALPNLFFDTAWWSIADQLQLYARVPPGRILYGSDMPYGAGALAAFIFRRCAAAVGLGAEAVRAIAGGQLERVVGGGEFVDVGPAPGPGALGAREVDAERVVTYASVATQVAFRGADPTEPLQLARLACRTWRTDALSELLGVCDEVLALALDARAARPEDPLAIAPGALVAMVLAGTPTVGVPVPSV